MRRGSAWTVIVFGVVAVTGLIDLPQPLEGDQSLFLVGAKEMAHGAVLYRDFWDLKQPGIFDFYYVAGVVGGFTSLSVHVLELVYLLAFAAVLWYALSRWTTLRAAAPVAPLFAVALYYVVSSSAEQVQVEALAGFPIFLATWLACEGTRRSGASRYATFAAAGVAAGCAMLLKFVFAPLLIAIFLTAIASPVLTYRRKLGDALLASVVSALGAGIPVGLTLAGLARGGALESALDTWFVVPPRIIATLPVQQISVLIESLSWFARTYGMAIVLAMAGIVSLFRSRADALSRCLFVWLIGGLATILAQRTSWWQYQWLLESVPLGIFAAAGLVALVRVPRKAASIGTLVLAALCAAIPVRIEVRKLAVLMKDGFALSSASRERFRQDVSAVYAGTSADAALLPAAAASHQNDLYVMGNPTYYVVTGRVQPLVLNGWAMELLLPSQRMELLRELKTTPPRYVYKSRDDAGPDIMMTRSPAFKAYFERSYRVIAHGAFGMLYEFR
ncbi:MAG: hypothetical protein GIX03_01170 [Candidatus Eremiobacteraeota bacterium]|nr:hypothetical protein [Candidatus Eremiobacteraeota bacterium]MBC5801632.1 hypothetical protein [Candidatus Eremiobacteraeota bacterium]MBC5822199.1 hypothetical protein [Candidatus Eremiobacteraeota bacterium]